MTKKVIETAFVFLGLSIRIIGICGGLILLFFMFLPAIVALLSVAMPDRDLSHPPEKSVDGQVWEYRIDDYMLRVPVTFGAVRYSEPNNGYGAFHSQLKFTLDLDTLKQESFESGYENQILVRIIPPAGDNKETNWLEADKILATPAEDCKFQTVAGSRYALCQHVGKGWPFLDKTEYFSIKDPESGKYLSRVECSLAKLIAPPCEVYAHIDDGLLIIYRYRTKHKNQAVEIDHRLRNLIASFIQPKKDRQ